MTFDQLVQAAQAMPISELEELVTHDVDMESAWDNRAPSAQVIDIYEDYYVEDCIRFDLQTVDIWSCEKV